MTKNTLLAATALTAMVFAGAASASEISAVTIGNAGVSPVVVGTDANRTFYYLASTAVQPGGATNFTSNVFTATQVAGTAAAPILLGAGTYDFQFTLTGTGSPVFATAVQAGDITRAGGTAACGVTAQIVNGGGAGQDFVVARVTFDANCANTAGPPPVEARANGVTLSRAIRVTSAGTVSVGGTISNVGTVSGSVTGLGAANASGTQTSVAKQFVKTIDPFVTTLAADTGATALSLNSTPVYSALSTTAGFDAVIGNLTFRNAAAPADLAALTAGGASAIYAGLNQTALPTFTATSSITATSGGDFTRLNATIGATTTTDVPAIAPATAITTTQVTALAPAASTAAPLAISLVADAGTPAVQISSTPITFSSAFTAAYATALAADQRFLTLPTIATTNLQTLTLEGTNFVAPWIAMQNSSVSLFRLSNQGATGTGPITLRLLAPNGGSVFATCTLTQPMLAAGTLVNGGIAANTAIAFNGKSLADNCFGTTSTNADVQVTIQGNATNLTAKVRTVNPSGDTSEQSLGRLLDGNTNPITF